jgi:hypothetical protein
MATSSKELTAIPDERIIDRIFLIRGRKVMVDRDLAQLYGVATRTLNQAVRRNSKRFPEDFMFQLTQEELEIWKSQIVISNRERMGLRKSPLVFTEQGVAMLSSVLNSERAIQVNIQIIRNFVRLRQLLATNEQLARKLQELEKRYDSQFQQVFRVITKLMVSEVEPKKGGEIGFLSPRDGKRKQP